MATPEKLTASRCFALNGTDRAGHKEQGGMIRRHVIRRNEHVGGERLREVVSGANAA